MDRRLRQRSTTAAGGKVELLSNGELLAEQSYTPVHKFCDDYYHKVPRPDGTLPPSDFEVETFDRRPYEASGTNGLFKFTSWALHSDFIHDKGSPYSQRGSWERNNENQVWSQVVLARSNPFRPIFSVPVFIRELLDITSMFKLAARTFAGYAGGAYLNYRFGWSAFVDDIRELHKITEAIEARVKEMKSLSQHGGLRRRIRIGSAPIRYRHPVPVYIHSSFAMWVTAWMDITGTMEVYGTARWRPVGEFTFPEGPLEAWNQACRLVFDLDGIDPETLWQMLPFSWLVDYFVNISQWLQTYNGYFEVEPYDICIMRHWRANCSFQVESVTPGIHLSGPGQYVREIKSRDVCERGSFPIIRTEFLSWSQWKVILALFGKFRG